MPAKHPRVITVLEPPLYTWLKKVARKDQVSISLKVRDLLREACDSYEDAYWSKVGEARLRSYRATKGRTHHQVWAKKR